MKTYTLKVRLEESDVEAVKGIAKALDVDSMSAAVRLLIRQTSKTLKARHDPEGAWYAAMWGGAPPLLEKNHQVPQAKTEADEEREAWDVKWGNKGPSAQVKGDAGPGETPTGDYASRFGNKK